MANFSFKEAVYGAMCYIAGEDDNMISAKEKRGIKPRFLKQHYLANDSMEAISYKWSQSPSNFYSDVIDSLNNCSYTQKLEAYQTICIILNDWTENNERWVTANKIREGMNISIDEYNNYIS